MTSFAKRNIAQGLRAHTEISRLEMPKIQLMDFQMWQTLQLALATGGDTGTVDWVDLGIQLSETLRNASSELIGKLAESASCSFRIDIPEETFLEKFGRRADWDQLRSDLPVTYFRARFAFNYWSSVRDFAVKSKKDCMAAFHLPWSMIDILAESSTSQVIDFCEGYPQLQRFSLNCSVQDCLAIADALATESTDSMRKVSRSAVLRLIKSNHCAVNFIPVAA